MDANKLADDLRRYNSWRRGGDGPQPDPTELGKVIESAADCLEDFGQLHAEIEQLRADAERYRWLKYDADPAFLNALRPKKAARWDGMIDDLRGEVEK